MSVFSRTLTASLLALTAATATVAPMVLATGTAEAAMVQVNFTVTSRALTSADLGKTIDISASGISEQAAIDCSSVKLALPGGTDLRNWSTAGCYSGAVHLDTKVTAAMVGKTLSLTGRDQLAVARSNLATAVKIGTETKKAPLTLVRPAVTVTAATRPAPTATATPIAAVSTAPLAPAAASAAGYTKLSFASEFNSLDEIDLTGAGVPGKKWYTDRPFGSKNTKTSDLTIKDGVLTINQTDDDPNIAIVSGSSHTTAGQAFQYGYFESRIRINPADFAGKKGWPSFWMMDADHFRGINNSAWGEIDIMEMYHEEGTAFSNIYTGTLHSHTDTEVDATSGFNSYLTMPEIDWTQFHTFGALWTPGRVTWFIDGKQVLDAPYSKSTNPLLVPQLDGAGRKQNLILGSGINLPMQVDWVRAWN